MSTLDWSVFLKQWNDEMLASPMAEELPENVRRSGWLGFPPATDEQMAAVEMRLRIPLPPSFKAFLKVSNGWHKTGHAIDRVWGTEQIDWFRITDPKWVEAWSRPSSYAEREPVPDDEYFAYDPAEDFRESHVPDTLQISAIGDAAVYLLNPQVISKDGEWEAWFMASWLPGVHRYRSFAEMMQVDHAKFAGLDWKQPKGIIGGIPNEYIGSPGSPERRVKPPTTSRDGPSVAELLAALDDEELALKMFPKARRIGRAGKMSGTTPSSEARRRVIDALGRRGDRTAVAPLVSIIETKDDHRVRLSAIDSLGRIGGQGAVDALLVIAEGNGRGAIHAMHALKELAPDLLPDLLLRQLDRASMMTLAGAGMISAELNETRALPILARIVEAPDCSDHMMQLATRCIASFGIPGLRLLEYLLLNRNPSVRNFAATALLDIHKPEVCPVLESLLNDADPHIRDLAALGLKLLPSRARRPESHAE